MADNVSLFVEILELFFLRLKYIILDRLDFMFGNMFQQGVVIRLIFVSILEQQHFT